jgi:hypothetical protein
MKRILISGLFFIACSSSPTEEKKLLAQANQIYLEAEAIQLQIEPEVDSIDSLLKLLRTKKTIRADSLAKNLVKLKADFEGWERNFFEVPGYKHTHKEHEHHHEHMHSPELPAEKMLEVQREIKANIKGIKKHLHLTLNEVGKILK